MSFTDSGGGDITAAPRIGAARGVPVSSVTNALRLLKEFGAAHRDLGVTELAKAIGTSKSTAHRLLSSLVREQLIERDEATGRYRLGVVVFELGMAVPLHRHLHAAAAPVMESIRARTGEAVFVGVVRGHELYTVDKLDSAFTQQAFRRARGKGYAHCTATGKAILADLRPEELDELIDDWQLHRRTPATITDPEALRAELRKVRRLGFAVDLEESDPGVVAVGAPIRSPHGRAVAGLSIIAPAENATPANMQAFARLVTEGAKAVSRRLVDGRQPA